MSNDGDDVGDGCFNQKQLIFEFTATETSVRVFVKKVFIIVKF